MQGPPLTLAQSRGLRRAGSCLQHAAPADELARRRSRAQHALSAGELTIRSVRRGRTHTIAAFGELDLATAPSVEAELISVEAGDARVIIVDLSGLTFMDSTGVHLIAAAAARCKVAAIRLRLLHGPSHMARLFAITTSDTLPFAA